MKYLEKVQFYIAGVVVGLVAVIIEIDWSMFKLWVVFFSAGYILRILDELNTGGMTDAPHRKRHKDS